uniref:Uncharacterized protein n=1 Tax=viral metagenome TaxID=1070528 RepID=A0A6C0CXP3_9ZZZZ
MSISILKNLSIKNIIINPCSKSPIKCLCVNYLDFSNINHYNIYKKCLHKNRQLIKRDKTFHKINNL